MLRPIESLIRFFATVNAPIARWGRSVAAVLLAITLAVALAQILVRALFNLTLDWNEDVARMALVWSVLLTAPIGYRSGGHVAIAAFAESLPPRLLYAVALLLNVAIGWICIVLLIESGDLVQRGLHITAATLPVRMVWVYAVVPVALTALVAIACEQCLLLWRALLLGRYDLPLSGVVVAVQSDTH